MDYLKIDGQRFYNMFVSASNDLEEQKGFVNSLNVFPVPDGDTGSNMSMTLKTAVSEIKNMKSESLGNIARQLAKGALMGARGNSGVILSQILRGISKGLEGKSEANSTEIANSINEGAKFAYKAVMRPTEGTILTIIRSAGEAALSSNTNNVTDLLKEVCDYSEAILNKTPEMLPALKKAKVVDSGGKGLLIILQGMYRALRDGIEDVELQDFEEIDTQSQAQNLDQEDIKYGYCTEFFVHSKNADIQAFKDKLSSMGDSMVVVSDEDIIKVHIHTNNPGWILSQAIKLGELSKIKIDNMREEHRHVLGIDNVNNKGLDVNNSTDDINQDGNDIKKYAFITVAMGAGLANMFKDLGVDCIIEGGQTMNPSTQDILSAVENINAEKIFIFPNNKNIFMAAKQASEISQKSLIVVPTKTIPQGITAITTFNSDLSVEENVKSMEEAIKGVITGSVTYAVRDTEIDGKIIKEGDILGLVDGNIKQVGDDIFKVCEDILDGIVSEDSDLISIYCGKDCDHNKIEEFTHKVENKYSDMDVQCYNGEQPLYYFIISVE
ncbi:DAK2 domain-containing protein [Clostridium tyrobutyricum]|uniref:DAK2 domain-containing protein n=1 Tax=Clostridium tyrobutyricum TaxID=1519 RepID=UPI001C387578|nr:DAK2 domain-containing protein [Clostridium tyrobutyricum]MBV4420773.1 DAK2 domain-containing protein [Clostridium tyrobutyricum]